jgi:hypothetical protein
MDGEPGGIWQPSPKAIETAKRVVTETDIPIHITRYVVVKAEQKKEPSSSEWLKWILADEQKAKNELRRTQASERKKGWADVED